VQYTSIDFGRTLRTCGVVASMGSIGDAFDNAMAESFFATLKEEMIYRRAWPTRHELEMEVFSFIEGFYNPLRRHHPDQPCSMPPGTGQASPGPARTRTFRHIFRCQNPLPACCRIDLRSRLQ
jgi:transposase InsO family protein